MGTRHDQEGAQPSSRSTAASASMLEATLGFPVMTITDVARAQALGIDPEKLDILLTRCRKDVDDGLLPS